MPFQYDPMKVCQKLRCKEMFIHDGTDTPEEHEHLLDDYDAVAYWCEETQTGRGPDGQQVHKTECSIGCSRSCFVGIESIA